MCHTPFLPQDFKKGCFQHTACLSNTQSLASHFLNLSFKILLKSHEEILSDTLIRALAHIHSNHHAFFSILVLTRIVIKSSERMFFFFLIILFHVCFPTRCKLNDRGAQSCSPRCPQSNHYLNTTGLKKHSWSRGTRVLLHEYLHFRRWTIIYRKLKPETQRSSLIPSPPSCHVANQSPNWTHSVYELPLQSDTLSRHFLLIQDTVFNNSHNCSHALGDVPSLKLSPSNPLSPHQTKRMTWSRHSDDCVSHYPWMKLNFCLLALPNLPLPLTSVCTTHHDTF